MARPRLVVPFLLLLTTHLFAAGRELAPRDLGQSAYRQSFATIAASGDRFLTLWREERADFGTHILGSLSDATGKRISTESFVVVPNANPTWMQLVPTDTGFTLFWANQLDNTQMVDLDLSGRVLASRRLNVPVHIYRDVAWNGTYFLMAFRHVAAVTNRSEAVIFTRTGEIVRSGIAVDDLAFAFDAVALGNAFYVVTASYNGMYGHRIGADGTYSQTLLASRPVGSQFQPIKPVAIPRSDGSLLIVWSAADQARSELSTMVVSPSDQITEPRLIVARDARRRIAYPLQLMRSGEHYVLTFFEYGENSYYVSTMTLDATGAIVSQAAEPVYFEAAPSAAANGTVTALAYVPLTYLRTKLVQRTVDAQGHIGNPELHSIARARQRQPILGAGGGSFLAAWEEVSDQSRVRLAPLDALGEPRSNQFLGPGELPAAGDLAWNGTEYLFTYWDGNNIRSVRLDANGRALDAIPFYVGGAVPSGLRIATTWAGDKWIVVYSTTSLQKLALTTISVGGVVTQHGTLEGGTPQRDGWMKHSGPVAIAANSERLYVTWIETQVQQCIMPICTAEPPTGWLMRYRHNGTPSSNAVRMAVNVTNVSIAASGEDFLLLTDSPEESKATIVDDDYGMTFLASRTLPGGLSDVTFDGRDYVIAQRHRLVWPRHLVISRFDRELNETAPPRGVETLTSDERVPPSIAAVMTGDSVVAIAEGDALNGSRAVVYAERDMQVLPDWPPPRRRAVR